VGGKTKPPKRCYQFVGIGNLFEFKFHNADYPNLMRGLMERLYFVKRDDVFTTPLPCNLPLLRARLGPLVEQLCSFTATTPMEYSAFCETYQGRKRANYERAAESLLVFGVTRKDARVKTFTKCEKINFTVKKDPAPRIIQPRDARYGLSLGVYIRPIEKRLYHSVSKMFGSVTIVKGLNADEVGRLASDKWNKFTRPVAVGMDASRFDQHVSYEILKHFEHPIYKRCWGGASNKRELSKLLDMQLNNEGQVYIDGMKVSYKVRGCRMSGDMNTGLGNCLIASSMIYAYCRDNGVTKRELLNNGDDCVLIVEEEDLPKLDNVKPYMADLGFDFVLEDPVRVLEEIEFCQSHFIKVDGSYRQIRTPKIVADKDSVTVIPMTTANSMESLLGAIGTGGLSLNSGVPVLQAMYQSLCRASKGKVLTGHPVLETGTMMLTRGMEAKTTTVTDETRYSYWLATGVLPDEQIALEHYYDSLTLAFGESDKDLDQVPLELFSGH